MGPFQYRVIEYLDYSLIRNSLAIYRKTIEYHIVSMGSIDRPLYRYHIYDTYTQNI